MLRAVLQPAIAFRNFLFDELVKNLLHENFRHQRNWTTLRREVSRLYVNSARECGPTCSVTTAPCRVKAETS
ncbi:hypothetical protein Pla8534_54730 [Lignipirellula cremea]|uniref:Uncharacterized protein n=1 Tax=Lignipirellula cremea TaxID=2528010 RepID=A0A518E0L6_9BACT|nr:hypothetical protein Pla8534_54730 [Lignipirellula cremea]